MSQGKHLLEHARDMRKAPTPFEAKLWAHLARSQLGGYKFRRQHVIDRFICDFFCPAKGLIVEIDGDTHEAERDAKRDALLSKQGYTTLRVTNADVGRNVGGVLAVILAQLEPLPDRWALLNNTRLPHPNPSPEGEGRL